LIPLRAVLVLAGNGSPISFRPRLTIQKYKSYKGIYSPRAVGEASCVHRKTFAPPLAISNATFAATRMCFSPVGDRWNLSNFCTFVSVGSSTIVLQIWHGTLACAFPRNATAESGSDVVTLLGFYEILLKGRVISPERIRKRPKFRYNVTLRPDRPSLHSAKSSFRGVFRYVAANHREGVCASRS
jgi:hypothetical protein